MKRFIYIKKNHESTMVKLNLDDILQRVVKYEPIARVALVIAGIALIADGGISIYKGFSGDSKYFVGGAIELFAGGFSLYKSFHIHWREISEETNALRAKSEKTRAETRVLEAKNFLESYDVQNPDQN